MNLAARTLITLATSPTPPAGVRTESLRTAWLIFGSLTLVLILFLTVIAVLMLDRHRRRRRRIETDQAEPGVDAWSEAGRRARGYGRESDGEDPARKD